MNYIKDHFDKVSARYSQFSNRGLWKLIRNIEARAIVDLLPEATDVASALDLGCGSGYYSDVLCKHGIKNITCVDFSNKMLEQIKDKNFNKIHADIEEYEPTQRYDVILCAGALEFIKDPLKVFINVSAALNKNACFVLLYPQENLLGKLYRYYHKQHGFSVRLYAEEDLISYAKSVGLKCINSRNVLPFSKVMKFV